MTCDYIQVLENILPVKNPVTALGLLIIPVLGRASSESCCVFCSVLFFVNSQRIIRDMR